MQFRLESTSVMDGRHSLNWLGFACARDDKGLLAEALAPLRDISWIRFLLDAIWAWECSGELYICDTDRWPDDIVAHGVEALRTRLLAAGLSDVNGAA